jgi:hypothetical protein
MSNESTRYPGLYKRAQRAYRNLIDPIRAIAKEHGYAVGVHGSLARDIDLIAAPWTVKPWPAEQLVDAIRKMCEDETGFADFAQDTPADKPEMKPHGRRAWSIVLGGGVYLDISVMPIIETKPIEDGTL